MLGGGGKQMERHRAARLIGACLLVCWAVPSASQEAGPEALKLQNAYGAMHKFLDAWLVHRDEAATMWHFAASEHSLKLAPRAVWRIARKTDLSNRAAVQHLWNNSLSKEYWRILGRLAVEDNERGVSLETVLAPIDPDLATALHAKHVFVVRTEPFTMFVADNDELIWSFDGGYGDVAAELQPTENTVLTMIADFAGRDREGYNGPFVSFWTEDESSGRWQIQALGAVPEGDMWIDGR
jgi:hypothetical protein